MWSPPLYVIVIDPRSLSLTLATCQQFLRFAWSSTPRAFEIGCPKRSESGHIFWPPWADPPRLWQLTLWSEIAIAPLHPWSLSLSDLEESAPTVKRECDRWSELPARVRWVNEMFLFLNHWARGRLIWRDRTRSWLLRIFVRHRNRANGIELWFWVWGLLHKTLQIKSKIPISS